MIPFTPKRLYQEMAVDIANDIRDGKYQIGERLPNERKLSESKGVSRSVIREAYLALEMAGIIEIKIGSGAYVRQISYDLMSMLFTLDMGPSPSDVIDTRIMLEGEICAHVAEHATDYQKQTIKNVFETLENLPLEFLKPDNHEDDLDYQFHIAIARASNPFNVSLMTFLWKTMRLPLTVHLEKTTDMSIYHDESVNDHRLITQAILQSNPEQARHYMREHLIRYKQKLLSLESAPEKIAVPVK